MERLTSRQQKAFDFIHNHTSSNGFAPSLRELCEHMGYRAVGSAQDVIASLRRKGYLEVPDQQKARSLALTRQAKQLKQPSFQSSYDDSSIAIPKLGSVPAGHPVEPFEDPNPDTLKIAISFLPHPTPELDQLFAVQAQGLSMIGAGILDGDWLIVKNQNYAEPSSIVVALVEGSATVKRLMKTQNGSWFLQPENPDFSPIFAHEENFEVIGQVVALQRTY
ncbi:MAG: repressor LexA [Pseudobacteriovorax sp.]|nr:repressor LexA [Pseudobacteriovorax sp.]